jgi:hypothetical protein
MLSFAEMAAFLKSVQNTGISEAEFVERYVQIPYTGRKGIPTRVVSPKRSISIEGWSRTLISSHQKHDRPLHHQARAGREPQGHHEKLSEVKQLAPDGVAKFSNVKAKLEIIGDDAEMGKVRNLLKELSNFNHKSGITWPRFLFNIQEFCVRLTGAWCDQMMVLNCAHRESKQPES